ncbi:MAG: thiamine pyrophosphate-dependent enzyme [Candidatus Bathyarchaeota archaeon]|nr:thiamine pyrophosphate-dependent enzyme [Candidatus Bathyarchaeota archaeon]
MPELDVMPGNKAVAHGVRLARVEVIPVFPITPQTTIVEYIASFIADGELDAEYIQSEGEHSCMGMAVGASLAGARTFTATCSQGLAYMHEVVAQAVSYRTPIVMAVANRVLGWYWSIGPDYSDVMPEWNLGWVVNFVESNQEALDMTLQLFKVAEDRRISLPAMLNLDGFYLSYSQERVEIPDQEAVDGWLPPYEAIHPVDPTVSDSWPSALIPPALHTIYRRKYEEVLQDSREVIEEVGRSFHETFGRRYGDLVEEYRCEDADALMVTMGSMTTAARRMVDRLRSEGEKMGLLKLRFIRPFPVDELRALAGQVDSIGVVDRVVLHGTGGGGVFTDVKAALYNLDERPPVMNFIAGMGGDDISIDDLYAMGKRVLRTSKTGRIDKEVEFIEHKAPPSPEPVKIEWDDPLYPGSSGCAGCGSSIILRRMLKVLGPDTVVVIPPCCGTINYPSVSKVPFVLANYAGAAAFETGFYRAYRKKGKADKIYLTSYSGDGGTVDIGLQAISAAAERGESIMWVCYDNEAYMNTGVQRSSSTPMFAYTTSTPVGEVWRGKPQRRKNMVLIMAAHRIPYIATASLAYLPDLERKIRRAAEVTREGKGFAYVHIQQPCAVGWYFPPEKTVEVGRLAVQTGAWPLLEVEDGTLKVNVKPRELKPIGEYLKLQRRFRHLSEEQIQVVQKEVSSDWESWLRLEKMGRLPWY